MIWKNRSSDSSRFSEGLFLTSQAVQQPRNDEFKRRKIEGKGYLINQLRLLYFSRAGEATAYTIALLPHLASG